MLRPPISIPWPLSSAPGANPQESAGRIINGYAEPLGQGGPSPAVWRRSPGLSAFATTGFTGYRGSILVGSLAYVAMANRLLTVTSGGVVTNVAALAGTKRVSFARNNVSPTPDIQCVDPDNGAFTITSASATSFTGGGNLPAPNCVAAQDGYFFWGIGDNRIFAAGPNSTTVNSNTFTTAQSRATGALSRIIPFSGLLWVFCTKFCEVYSNTANPFPGFPYTRLKVFDRGLLGPNAIAGWEDGFGKLYWVADDFGVWRLDAGLQPEKVSPPDLDRLIKAVTDVTTLEASCYVHAGHSFWALSAPGWSWEFNLNTQQWNERASLSSGLLTRWRATGGLNAFGKWLCGDVQTGNLDYVDDTVFTEVAQPLLFRMESGPVKNFPNRARIARADFDFITGVGIASGATLNHQAPRVGISLSRDGGINWDNPVLRALGVQADAKQRVWGLNWGQAGPHGARWRFDISDPAYAAFLGATMSDNPRAM